MKVLSMGLPFGAGQDSIDRFSSQCGHEVRILAAEGMDEVKLDTSAERPIATAQYTFSAGETAAAVIARIAGEWAPEVLICWLPEMFPPPRAIEQCPIKTVAIVSDWNVYYAQLEYNLSRYDIVLTDKLGAQTLCLPGATPEYLYPLYSHQSSIHCKRDIEKDIDILFVGNLNHTVHVKRGRCLEKVAALSDRYRVMLRSGVYGEDYATLLNRARIVVNHSLRSEMNLRCFETLACHALLFMEEDNLEVRDYLCDGEEMVLYRPDNLTDRLIHYLEHPDEAARITNRGHAKVADLAGENRLDTLFDWIAEHPRGERALGAFSEEKRAYADIMQYSSSLVPSQRAMLDGFLASSTQQFPEQMDFQVASASNALAKTRVLPEEERAPVFKAVLHDLKKACLHDRDCAVFWYNLAYVCRHGQQTSAEMHCLELVLKATSCHHIELLMGGFDESYYAFLRTAAAHNEIRIEMFWAASACRLAELQCERGHDEEARTIAAKSIEWLPELSHPYRLLATAEGRLGNWDEAVRVMEEGLPLTAFDPGYRQDLIEAYRMSGRQDEAQALAKESAQLFTAYWGADDFVVLFESLV